MSAPGIGILFAVAPVDIVVGHHTEHLAGLEISGQSPMITVFSAVDADVTGLGIFTFKKGDCIFFDLFNELFVGKAEVFRADQFGGIVALAVGHQGKVFRIAFGEAAGVPQ